MGLAAGQARLLTITGRKSDCEFESMRLSHQKIALARQLADLSNEYQNSLNQTKLIYDYYGTGDTSTQLSYNILMQPSALNNYMPTTLTDSMGRVCLNSKYAAAAFAAGIPQEGLGTLPSEVLRNSFITALAGEGVISPNLAKTITALPYNQQAGFGGGATVVVETKDLTRNEFVDYLIENADAVEFSSAAGGYKSDEISKYYITTQTGTNSIGAPSTAIWGYNTTTNNSVDGWVDSNYNGMNFGSMLNEYLKSNKSYYLVIESQGSDSGNHNNTTGNGNILDQMLGCGFWDGMLNNFEEILDDGSYASQKALEYARNKMESMLVNPSRDYSEGYNWVDVRDWGDQKYNDRDNIGYNQLDGVNDVKYAPLVKDSACYTDGDEDSGLYHDGHKLLKQTDCNGAYILISTDNNMDDNDGTSSAGQLNLSTMLMSYLTYFYDYKNGISKTDVAGADRYKVADKISESRFIDEQSVFTIKTGKEISSDDLGQAAFYDALFNQICYHGWTENNNINDNEYLQKMLQTGMLYVSNMKDDGYYYQGDYATDKYIKEIPDETLIANAEAKYNTEKAKLNAKEETLDLKMKNLDTEISALTTEYDSVKNTISKQIEKAFKRYSA